MYNFLILLVSGIHFLLNKKNSPGNLLNDPRNRWLCVVAYIDISMKLHLHAVH